MKTHSILIAILVVSAAVANAQAVPSNLSKATRTLIQGSLVDFDNKKYDDALKKLEVAYKDAPTDPFVLNLLGAAYTKKKDYNQAKTYFEKSLEVAPDFFPSLFNIGELLFLQRRYSEALAYFQSMQKSAPGNELVQFKIFLCYLQLNDKAEAEKALKRIKYPSDTPAWYYAQAAWESKQGNNKKALEYLTGARYIFGPKTALFEETFEDLGIKLR